MTVYFMNLQNIRKYHFRLFFLLFLEKTITSYITLCRPFKLTSKYLFLHHRLDNNVNFIVCSRSRLSCKMNKKRVLITFLLCYSFFQLNDRLEYRELFTISLTFEWQKRDRIQILAVPTILHEKRYFKAQNQGIVINDVPTLGSNI